MNIDKTMNERSNKYGPFEEVAKITEDLMEIIYRSPRAGDLTSIHKQTYMMIFHKIARSVCGDPTYVDNIHDIVGYAKLLEDYLIKTNGE